MKRISLFFIACLALLSAQAQDDGFSVEMISDSLFQKMLGRSFPANCTTPRSDLRHLRVLHRNAEDSVLHGELVCNKAIADDLLDIFRQLYEAHYPIEHIRLIDDYEADDELSMRDNNSSSFCFRVVSGTTKLSKHACGMAVDINTRYNPYVRTSRSGHRLVSPDNGRPYADRTQPFPYKIEEGDLLYRLFTEHGFTWGGHWRTMKDYQHFEK